MKMKRLVAVVLGSAMVLTFASAAFAADTSATKWFVCKYVGTPGVDEVLQSGGNPISVDENAIKETPVVPGSFFADAQGRSYVLVQDTGQPEPDVSLCPPASTPSPTPPEVTPTPTLPNETATPTLPVETATPTLPTNETPTPTLPQTSTIDQSNTGGPGTSLTLVFALILAVAGGLMAYAMRPRRVGNR